MLTCRNGIIFILIFLLSLCCLSDASAHDEDVTHRDITANAIKRSSLGNYLIYNLGIFEGTKKVLGYNENYLMIEQWLQEGSKLEDNPTCRASNHFHNPLDSWNLSYINGSVFGQVVIC